MELLIEFIVWVFKVLFGPPEQPADVEPTRSMRQGQASADATRPKTLEEILLEVRRQAAERQGAAPLAPPPSSTPPPQARPPFSSPLATPGRTLVPQQAAPRPAPPRTLVPQQARPQPQSSTQRTQRRPEPAPYQQPAAPKPQAPQAPRVSKIEAEPEDRKAAVVGRLVEELSPEAAAEMLARQNRFAFLTAIRKAAPAEKRVAARQAIIMYEVFGPPISRRQRAGRRGIL